MHNYKRTKKALLVRLDKALANVYHNATPRHPWQSIPESLQESYLSWFECAARFEVDYISDNLGCTAKEYARNKRLGWPCAKERHFYLVSRITEFGKLYTWGRGGRTLAPKQLVTQRGGSSFHVLGGPSFDEMSNAQLVETIEIVEAFNAYVEQWNSRENLLSMWRDHADCMAGEIKGEAESTRKKLAKLAREAKALAGIAGPNACEALQGKIESLRAMHRDLIRQLSNWRYTMRAGV